MAELHGRTIKGNTTPNKNTRYWYNTTQYKCEYYYELKWKNLYNIIGMLHTNKLAPANNMDVEIHTYEST